LNSIAQSIVNQTNKEIAFYFDTVENRPKQLKNEKLAKTQIASESREKRWGDGSVSSRLSKIRFRLSFVIRVYFLALPFRLKSAFRAKVDLRLEWVSRFSRPFTHPSHVSFRLSLSTPNTVQPGEKNGRGKYGMEQEKKVRVSAEFDIQLSKDCSTKRFILFKSSVLSSSNLVLPIKCEVLLAIQTSWVFAGGHSFCNFQFYRVYTFKFCCALHCTYLIDFIVWPPQKLRLQILGVNVLKSIVDF